MRSRRGRCWFSTSRRNEFVLCSRRRPAGSTVISRRLRLLQAADRSVGPWLCRRIRPTAGALAAESGEAISPNTIRRILVVRPGGLGDAALTYPLLGALRSGFPGADVEVLGERRNAGIYRIGDIVSRIHVYDDAPLATLRRLKRARYDLVIDTEQYHHLSVLVANALRPRFLAGFDVLGRARFHTHSVPHDEETYEARAFLRLAEVVLDRTIAFDAERAFIEVDSASTDWAQTVMAEHSLDKFVAVTPVAGGPYRLWPPTRYAEVIAWLMRRDYPVVLLGGADGVTAAESIVRRNPGAPILNLAGQTSLAESAALLQMAELSLSADTGILHLACGVGTPTVALFGPGRHRQWAPPGPRHRIVRKGLPCSPCMNRGRMPPCPIDIACMRDIGVDDVTAELAQALHC